MTNLFSRWLPCTTLLTWSAILLYFHFSGRTGDLLVPMFRTPVLLAGLGLLALGACFLFLPGVAGCCHDDQCGHPLGRMSVGRLLTFAVLLLPVGIAAKVSPDQFSRSAIMNRGIITDAEGLANRGPRTASLGNVEPPLPTKDGAQPSQENLDFAPSDFTPRTKDGHISVQVIDLLYAAQDTSLRADLENQTVELIGQLMPDSESNVSGKRFKVVRMFMTCCAADARPVAALVEPSQKPDIAEMTWVKVVGRPTFPVENGRTIAVLKADKIVQTDPPDETMLY